MSDRRDFLQTLLATALTSAAASAATAATALSETPTASAATVPSKHSLDPEPQQQAAGATQTGRASRLIHRQPLPAPFEGLDAAFAEVTVQPGAESRPHRHSGFVLGYVIEGEFLFGTNNEQPRIVRAGEIFYEAPGMVHSVSASARPDRPVKFLAIVIGKQGEPLTTTDR